MTNNANQETRNAKLWGEGEYDIPVIVDKDSIAECGISGILRDEIHKRRIGNKVVNVVYIKGDKAMFDAVMNSYYSEIKKEERDRRCLIGNGKGRLIRCPECVKNPETGEMEANSCKNCPYYNLLEKDNFHTLTFSSLSGETEEGDSEAVEPGTDRLQDEGERYERILKEMIDYVNEINPLYGEILSMAERGIGQVEIGKMVHKSQASVNAYLKKIKPIVKEFLENVTY